MSNLKATFTYLLAIFGCAVLIALLFTPDKVPYTYKAHFTHAEIDKLNPALIIDHTFLMNENDQNAAMQVLMDYMISRGLTTRTSTGDFYRLGMDYSGYRIPVLIQSRGGSVDLGLKAIKALQSLSREGMKVDCYVSEASSMALTLMIQACDKVIAKKSVRFMQHRVSAGDLGQTPRTFQIDVALSKAEASKLGLKWEDWNMIARGEKDHRFTLEEIELYKLVNEWID